MDHLKHFGLKDDPFRNEPQLDSYFESRSHADAVRRLSRCAHQRKELGLLVGEAGSGKTTVARVLFEALDPDVYDVALLVVARGAEPEWLRAGIAQQLGIESPSASRAECAKQLYAQLVEICEAGRRAVVLVDEAHALDAAALAELRALLNFEHEEQRLLTVLLVGHAALVKALEQDPVLQGRVEARVVLAALADAEGPDYLAHRLRVAGADPGLFAPEVAAALTERAAGLPRRMNTLADNALFEAHCAGRDRVTIDDVERAADELGWSAEADDKPDPPQARSVAEAAVEDVPSAPLENTNPSGRARPEAGNDPFAEAPPADEELDGIFAELVDEV